eukprot:GHUV01033287.1.p1 GENE.GHUV01033287.1~~GHUV01033287.1.p1  ORF type:complete len:117 (-),score=32.58 GHUV01033287.1:110-460(-)
MHTWSCSAGHAQPCPHSPNPNFMLNCTVSVLLTAAGLQASQVDYVNAHATSTPAGDMAEYRAIRSVMPQQHLRMNSTKSMIGHLLGGAGAVEAVATVMSINTGTLMDSFSLSLVAT